MTYPQAPPTTAKTQVIIDWITSLGWDVTQESGYPLLPGPEIVDAPAQAVFITGNSGPGWVTEEAALDCSGFQARTRGPVDDPLAAELAAQQLDVLILNAPRNVVIDGIVITFAARTGSPPTPLPLDPADRRFEFTCNYLITTGSE